MLQFSGHVNSSAIKLVRTSSPSRKQLVLKASTQGIAVDPTEDFVFAAGQDRRVRGWSLRTGQRIAADPINSRAAASLWREAPPEQTRLFDVLFDEPITTMQVTTDGAGPCMWAACGGELYRMPLGRCLTGSGERLLRSDDSFVGTTTAPLLSAHQSQRIREPKARRLDLAHAAILYS